MAQAASATTSAQLTSAGALAQVVYVAPDGSDPGTVKLRNGGASGDILLEIATVGGDPGVVLPLGDGIYFPDGIYAALDTVDGVTVVYSPKP